MAEELKYPWQQELLDAFLSPQRELPQKIAVAERAIAARLRQATDTAEQTALRDGLRALRVLISETEGNLRRDGDEDKDEKERARGHGSR
jgi:hypothetical protein